MSVKRHSVSAARADVTAPMSVCERSSHSCTPLTVTRTPAAVLPTHRHNRAAGPPDLTPNPQKKASEPITVRSERAAAMSEFLLDLLGERLVNREKAELDVHSLGSRLSLLGLYFGSSLNAPCKQFNASLCEFYSKFKKSSEHKDKLEVVFISSDQDQKQWQDFLQEMTWPALPFKDRHKKLGGVWKFGGVATIDLRKLIRKDQSQLVMESRKVV